jgi:hypothetical protein
MACNVPFSMLGWGSPRARKKQASDLEGETEITRRSNTVKERDIDNRVYELQEELVGAVEHNWAFRELLSKNKTALDAVKTLLNQVKADPSYPTGAYDE